MDTHLPPAARSLPHFTHLCARLQERELTNPGETMPVRSWVEATIAGMLCGPLTSEQQQRIERHALLVEHTIEDVCDRNDCATARELRLMRHLN